MINCVGKSTRFWSYYAASLEDSTARMVIGGKISSKNKNEIQMIKQNDLLSITCK